MKQNKPIILIVLLSLVIIATVIYSQKNEVKETVSHKTSEEADMKDELIIYLFMDNIKSDSSTFYDYYFSSQLTYYSYETKVLELKKDYAEGGIIHITFGSTPMIGAHNPVGYDELVYKVDAFGNITLEKYTHLKSFDIPEWLRENMIKPYPE
ncbi:MAG TPA: DUF3888 domain-containing protein [Mobilitalea sp.]|nr:DUF3888 domain-containing protein [Mobilitalea sp.]